MPILTEAANSNINGLIDYFGVHSDLEGYTIYPNDQVNKVNLHVSPCNNILSYGTGNP
ncbi:hypothetical protein SAMN05421761_1083 [Belliella pelovolcani]|uniref:Uncharacterized protein n=1 Tax=Belliella pelovolcani TaxID=529505 RepID=A0A1N7MYW9_9BACT|nr:hypothetical protein [Belliella pelovolcani]SIS91280.1 hypothetical protein SAMN05421761_1083 [Belliella pelovolcani]